MDHERRQRNFEQQRLEQERRALELSYEQRLRWLDQAKRFCATALGAARTGQRSNHKDDASK